MEDLTYRTSHVIPAQLGFKVLLGRTSWRYGIASDYRWFETETVVAWSVDMYGELSPITVKHGLIQRGVPFDRNKHLRFHGIVQPDGKVVNICGTFADIEEYRMFLHEDGKHND